jgi:hypothetical protein
LAASTVFGLFARPVGRFWYGRKGKVGVAIVTGSAREAAAIPTGLFW